MSARSAVAALLGLIALAWAAPAGAFVQSRGSEFRECLSWNQRSLQYGVNGAGTRVSGSGCATPEEAVAAVRAGFDAWPQAAGSCTDLTFTFAGTTPSRKTFRDQQNVVLFRSRSCANVAIPANDPCRADNAAEDCSSKYDCWDEALDDVIAITSVLYVQQSGEIFEADMEFNALDASGTNGFLLTCTAGQPPAAPPGQTDIRNTATHEAGHFLGLAHPCQNPDGSLNHALEGCDDPAATMYPTSPAREIEKRSLEQDDINGVCFVYPRGGATPTVRGECEGALASPLGEEDNSGCGCGSAHPGSLALLAVPALLLRRRRRSPQV